MGQQAGVLKISQTLRPYFAHPKFLVALISAEPHRYPSNLCTDQLFHSLFRPWIWTPTRMPFGFFDSRRFRAGPLGLARHCSFSVRTIKKLLGKPAASSFPQLPHRSERRAGFRIKPTPSPSDPETQMPVEEAAPTGQVQIGSAIGYLQGNSRSGICLDHIVDGCQRTAGTCQLLDPRTDPCHPC